MASIVARRRIELHVRIVSRDPLGQRNGEDDEDQRRQVITPAVVVGRQRLGAIGADARRKKDREKRHHQDEPEPIHFQVSGRKW
jgi:hypothetical protein